MRFSSISQLGLGRSKQQKLEELLIDFDRSWSESALKRFVGRLAKLDGSVRRATMEELVMIDLERRWSKGKKIRLEQYLDVYRELGDTDSVSPDLILAEYQARLQAGQPCDVTMLKKRFPHQADSVVRRIHDEQPSEMKCLGTELERPTDIKPASTVTGFGPHSDALQLPEQFGSYRVVRSVSVGGMGAVFLAEDRSLNRKVALKVPLPHLMTDDGMLRRFRTEAQAVAALSHPNIVTIHEVAEEMGFHYIAMEYIEGSDLSDLIVATPYTEEGVAVLVRQLATTLAFAHDREIIHRDLKPSNIRIDTRGEPIIMDFGLARITRESISTGTRTGTVMGTPNYMPPEQALGQTRKVGTRSDIYSLGAIMYELLAGRPPYYGSYVSVLAQIATKEPTPVEQIRSDVVPELIAICRKAMQRESKNRFASMAEFADTLRTFLEGTPNASLAGSPPDATVVEQDQASPRSETTHLVRNTPTGPTGASTITVSQAHAHRVHRSRRQLVSTILVSTIFVSLLGLMGVLAWFKFFAGPSDTQPITESQPNTGTVKFSFHPSDVAFTAFVDNQQIDLSDPSRPLEFPVGEHWLRVECDGYEAVVKPFVVESGRTLPISLQLQRLQGSIEVRLVGVQSFDEVEVSIDGESVAAADLSKPLDLEIGEHVIEVSSPHYEAMAKKVQVLPNGNVPVTLQLKEKLGAIVLELPENVPAKNVQVRIDDRLLQPRALAQALNLPPGAHQIDVRGVDFEPWSRQIYIEPGETRLLAVNLHKRAEPADDPLPAVVFNTGAHDLSVQIDVPPDMKDLDPAGFALEVLDVKEFSSATVPFSPKAVRFGDDIVIRFENQRKGEIRLKLINRSGALVISVGIYVDSKRVKYSEETLQDRLVKVNESIGKARGDLAAKRAQLNHNRNMQQQISARAAGASNPRQRFQILSGLANYPTRALERSVSSLLKRIPRLESDKEKFEAQIGLWRAIGNGRVDYRIFAKTDKGEVEIGRTRLQ